MFVDSHCHLEMESYDKDRVQVVGRSIKEGISAILTVATEQKYFGRLLSIVDAYPIVYGAAGIHPHNSTEFTEDVAGEIAKLALHPKVVAYGEIGLDFFRNYAPRKAQTEAFAGQIRLASRLAMPVIIHSRNARDETVRILRDEDGCSHGGVIHCFSYDIPTARELLDMGFHLSIPGTITYKQNSTLEEVVRFAPIERLLSETDAPFLTPAPHRGKRNEPAFVKIVVEKIAALLNRGIDEIGSILTANFERLFLKGAAP